MKQIHLSTLNSIYQKQHSHRIGIAQIRAVNRFIGPISSTNSYPIGQLKPVSWSYYRYLTGVVNRFTGKYSHSLQQLLYQKDTHIPIAGYCYSGKESVRHRKSNCHVCR